MATLKRARTAFWRSIGSLREQGGQVLPLVVLFLLILIGVAGLVIDGGMAYATRRQMQNAADAAVLACGNLFAQSQVTDAQVVNTTTYYALANSATSVTVYYVDANQNVLGQAGLGSVPGGAMGVRVVAARSITPFFSQIVGIGVINVTAVATGGLTARGGNAIIIALDGSACEGLRITGSGLIRTVGGGIWVNSTCSQAMEMTGSADVEAVNSFINVVGGFRQVGSGTVTPYPTTGSPPIADPLASVAPPDISSYPVRYGSASNPKTLTITGSGSTTLDPGVYFGGIRFTGSGSVTFRPGVYIIAGGQFNLTGSGTVTADGCFFYVTNDPWKPTGDGAYANIKITGSGSWRFRPMDSGPYRNITFFQDRANTQQVDITGSGDMLSGTLYFPSAHLDIAGSGNMSGTAQLIAASIDMTGSGTMTYTYDVDQIYGLPSAIIVH